MKVIYISGPITGVPDYQTKFDKVEKQLTEAGFTVLNPSKLPSGLTNEQYMRIDLAMIDAADAVVLLPKWNTSRGSRFEVDYCLYTHKRAFFSVEELLKEVRP